MPLSSVVGASSILRPGVCTSTSRPASPFEGQTIYETDTDRLATWDGSAWIAYVRQTAGKVLQVASTTKTDTFTTTNTSYTEITGLTASITPASTSSQIFITISVDSGSSADVLLSLRLMRGTTAIGIADAAGSRTRATVGRYLGTATTGGNTHISISGSFLDSPSTTSSTTYSVQIFQNAAGTVYVNRGGSDNDLAGSYRAISTITLMEISG